MSESKRPLKVFLCHAHADRDPVRGLYTRLTQDGVDAWLDKANLLPGQDWELEIRKAVREADVVVVCLSKQFNQAGFRQKEVRLALDTAMEQPEGEIFIIPARLEECDNLESLRKWHWVDLFEDDGYEMLMRALRTRADKIGVTLHIKKKRAPKKNNQEKRIFYDLTAHYECDFENTTPEILANFLFETLTRIMRTVTGVDKNKNSHTAEYQTSQVEYLDPKNGKTTQHALIVHGKKVHLGKGDIQGVEPLTVVPEMLIITVTQGVNHSRIRFDSNELPTDAFKNLVEWILADIGKTVTVQIKDDTVAKVSLPKQEQPETKIPKKQNVSTLGEKAIDISKPKAVGPESKKTKPSRKLNIAIIVALIGFVGTIVAAWLNSPLFSSTLAPTKAPTATITLTLRPVTPSLTIEPSPTLTETITPTPTLLPDEIIDTKGISMRLVRAGEFTMGFPADDSYSFCKTISSNITWYGPPCSKEDYLHEEPVHKVYLSNFFIDVYEVSNEEYKKCVADRVCAPPSSKSANRYSIYYDNENFRNYPVLNVTWNAARSYCEWRGARLPTEAEWEKAARGIDGRSHPWDALNSAYELYTPDFYKDKANLNISASNKSTMSVTSNPKGLSPYDLYNMAGNVAEWVADWYSETYYEISPYENPLGSLAGDYKVIRGGSVNTYEIRTTARDYRDPLEFESGVGIRCAMDAP